MPARHLTRAVCVKLPRYKNSASVAQLVCGLRRMILYGDSIRTAVATANAASRDVEKYNLLTSTTLFRFHAALPDELKRPESATEGALLAWIDEYECGRREERSAGGRLFTRTEEELIAQWVDARAQINAAVGRSEIIEHARGLLQSGEHGFMREWYRGFRLRFPDLRNRREQSTPHARLSAELSHDNVAHFFQLLASFTNLPPSQKWAGDETGLGADTRQSRDVVALAGTKRVKTGKARSSIHIGLMHIGNGEGVSLSMLCVIKGKFLTTEHIAALDDDALIGVQDSGQFLQSHFITILQHLITHGPKERPLLFILDGAGSHVDMAAINFAIENRINILLLPSNLTHKLQVADVAVFGPLKRAFTSVSQRLRKERARQGQVRQPRIGDRDASIEAPLIAQCPPALRRSSSSTCPTSPCWATLSCCCPHVGSRRACIQQ